MARGACLGFLLICLVQAEHVRCLRATRGEPETKCGAVRFFADPRRDSDVGLAQQDRGVGGSYPQNRPGPAFLFPRSAWGGSRNAGPLVGGGSSRGLSSSGYVEPGSGRAAVGALQGGSASNPNWLTPRTPRVNVPKRPFGFHFASVASGSTASRHNQPPRSKKPIQQGSPSRESDAELASQRSTAQKAAATRSSRLFGTDVHTRPRSLFRTKTSASGLGKRVSPHRGSKTSKPFSSVPNNKITRLNFQNEAAIPNQGDRFSVSNVVASNEMSKPGAPAAFLPHGVKAPASQHYAPTRIHNIPYQFGGFAIRRLKERDLTPQSYVAAPQAQSYVAPQRPAAPQAYLAPQRTAALQSYLDPQQQSASSQPWVPSGPHVSRWIRVQPPLGLKHVL
ncbi:hypothetical protein PFLUV_G00152530 [Perca fluviatilis]|uniref:Uncharacterized protein n=1 Tax=Perca fluviatilis TaxID=8168 RepID=A0A6A5ESC1_PERFL|nr:uncharacterized protein LOC120571127 [Perca fluviatilis]KAF1381309.1 hypothetical protein PFLUV_G00152530 [Perca fluviatilis]